MRPGWPGLVPARGGYGSTMADQPTNDGRDDVDIDLTDATIAEERREANTAHVADLRHTDAAPKAAREPRVKRSVRMSE